jgi:hypothetical protein
MIVKEDLTVGPGVIHAQRRKQKKFCFKKSNYHHLDKFVASNLLIVLYILLL